MLPGYLSLAYELESIRISLYHLCQMKGVNFILDQVVGWDPDKKLIHLKNTPSLPYDILSWNLGSEPNPPLVGREFVTPVKPLSVFIESYQKMISSPPKEFKVVGGGAGSIELAFSLRNSFKNSKIQIISSQDLLYQFPKSFSQRVRQRLEELNIEFVANVKVESISQFKDRLIIKGIQNSSFLWEDSIQEYEGVSPILWATHASPIPSAHFPRQYVDKNGFLSINSYLEVCENVYAVGDISEFPENLPKAGVVAVRQAPILLHNIFHSLGILKSKIPYNPQNSWLFLLGDGTGKAFGRKSFWNGGPNKLLWIWKRWIDEKFMNMFTMHPNSKMSEDLCKGCSSKMGEIELSNMLGDTNWEDSHVSVMGDEKFLETFDYISLFDIDPFFSSQIALIHACNDIWVRGGKPDSIMSHIVIPKEKQNHSVLIKRIYQGLTEGLTHLGIKSSGGHSSYGEIPGMGISVRGILGKKIIPKQPSSRELEIWITKPLGVGILFRALMDGRIPIEFYEYSLPMILESHQIFHQVSEWIDSATDISGFGLYRHLRQALLGSNLGAEILIDQIPMYPGVKQEIERGTRSTFFQNNFMNIESKNPIKDILFDPQTSGPILYFIDNKYSKIIKESLIEHNLTPTQIGRTTIESGIVIR